MTELFDLTELENAAAALIEAARRNGATAADAVAARGESLSVTVRDGAVEESERSESDDFTLRVFVGKKVAFVSANVVDNPDTLAERAVAMARVAPEDQFAGIADAGALADKEHALDILDKTIPTADDLTARAKAAEAAALAVDGVTKSNSASASWGMGGFVLAATNGFRRGHLASRHSVSASAIAGSGTDMETDYDYSIARHLEDLESAEAVGAEAGRRVVRQLGPKKIGTMTGAVVYEPRTAATLVGHLSGAISGAAVARGTSFLKDALGDPVFAEGVTVLDDPMRQRGLRARPFDGEGLPATALDLIDDGRLRYFLLDLASSRELEMAPNGRAARGGGSPSPSATNLALLPGSETPEALIGNIKDGIFVTSLIGQGVNMVTGDYSRGATGLRIENGELTHPVSEITIAGNLRDMFRRLVPASDLKWKMATNAPTILIEDLTIAGR